MDCKNFEVELEPERIITHKEVDGYRIYLIKWKNVPDKFNLWLPVTELIHCGHLLYDYFSRNIELHPLTPTVEQKVMLLYRDLKKTNESELKFLVKEFLTVSGLKLPLTKMNSILKKLSDIVKKGDISDYEQLQPIRKGILIEEILIRRKAQLSELTRSELQINMISDSNEIIKVENFVDLEVLPSNFIYINENIAGNGVVIPNDPLAGCDCVGGCYSANCCPRSFNTLPAYKNKPSRVVVANRLPIYECNSRCACDKNCVNRVVQNGSDIKLCIFKTFNGCGWGVYAMQNIQRGSFIAKYIGEVITWEESNKRCEDDNIRRYLFDLDFNRTDPSEHCLYTIDASKYGNVSHFINHSCDPNLSVYSAYINCLDPDLHNVCLFANRFINKGEELTFNYMADKTILTTGNKQICKCASVRCKRYLM